MTTAAAADRLGVSQRQVRRLITDHRHQLGRLHGSDGKRLRHLRDALGDLLHAAWLLLPDDARRRGQDTLPILSA